MALPAMPPVPPAEQADGLAVWQAEAVRSRRECEGMDVQRGVAGGGGSWSTQPRANCRRHGRAPPVRFSQGF